MNKYSRHKCSMSSRNESNQSSHERIVAAWHCRCVESLSWKYVPAMNSVWVCSRPRNTWSTVKISGDQFSKPYVDVSKSMSVYAPLCHRVSFTQNQILNISKVSPEPSSRQEAGGFGVNIDVEAARSSAPSERLREPFICGFRCAHCSDRCTRNTERHGHHRCFRHRRYWWTRNVLILILHGDRCSTLKTIRPPPRNHNSSILWRIALEFDGTSHFLRHTRRNWWVLIYCPDETCGMETALHPLHRRPNKEYNDLILSILTSVIKITSHVDKRPHSFARFSWIGDVFQEFLPSVLSIMKCLKFEKKYGSISSICRQFASKYFNSALKRWSGQS